MFVFQIYTTSVENLKESVVALEWLVERCQRRWFSESFVFQRCIFCGIIRDFKPNCDIDCIIFMWYKVLNFTAIEQGDFLWNCSDSLNRMGESYNIGSFFFIPIMILSAIFSRLHTQDHPCIRLNKILLGVF